MEFSRNPTKDHIEKIHQDAEERHAMRRAREEGVSYSKEETIPTRDALLLIEEEKAKEKKKKDKKVIHGSITKQ